MTMLRLVTWLLSRRHERACARVRMMSSASSYAAASLGCALVLSTSQLAHAQARDGTGFEGGLRIGYGIPLGEAGGLADLDDAVSGQVPLWLDLGYRVIPEVFIGVYGQYGIAFLSDDCDAVGLDCSASDVRIGLQGQFSPSPEAEISPWFGVGVGYEWLSISQEGAGVELSTTMHGFEFVHLQGGVDFRVAEHVRIGPLLSFSLGQFSEASVDCSGGAVCDAIGEVGGEIPDKKLHEWLVLGVRAVYGP
jgi:hypothetical protein